MRDRIAVDDGHSWVICRAKRLRVNNDSEILHRTTGGMGEGGLERVTAHDSGVELSEQLGKVDVWIWDDPIELTVGSRNIPIQTGGHLIAKSAHVRL